MKIKTSLSYVVVDTLTFLEAVSAIDEDLPGASYWRLRKWAEQHDVYIDDLGTQRAIAHLARCAAQELRAVLSPYIEKGKE